MNIPVRYININLSYINSPSPTPSVQNANNIQSALNLLDMTALGSHGRTTLQFPVANPSISSAQPTTRPSARHTPAPCPAYPGGGSKWQGCFQGYLVSGAGFTAQGFEGRGGKEEG